jgi:uncharacterized membrane-anchored protein YjiN (DUF445 family)
MEKIEINVYDYDELRKEYQQKVIRETIEFILAVYPEEELSENIKKGIDRAEELNTPWFMDAYIMDYAEKEILDTAREFQYDSYGNVMRPKPEETGE